MAGLLAPFFTTKRRVVQGGLLLLAWTFLAVSGYAQRRSETPVNTSGGPLMPEQAAYKVMFYDLTLRVDPAKRSIAGALVVRARIVHPTNQIVLDLDESLAVNAVSSLEEENRPALLHFERRGGKIWIAFPLTRQPGDSIRVRVAYGGKPRVAPNPPWTGGFTWAHTASGAPWVGVSCQMEGADLWWPCKDHPSDRADSMALHITVPEPLICAANGHLAGDHKNADGTHTYDWSISTPINNYAVSINIAPYRTITGPYSSTGGQTVPVTFWVLPEDYENAQGLFRQFLKQIRFLEERLGPYPFRKDKIGVAETPYLGMEHQTITAYGNHFRDNGFGFDALLFHEFAHEWFANLVTNYDWRDMWLHEGFASYMEALYAEALRGETGYRGYLADFRKGVQNLRPVASRESETTDEVYSSSDIYFKGALILHTLRFLLGDRVFFTALRRMAYPDPKMEAIIDGKQCRFATTDDFLHIAEAVSGMKLGWFFEVYLRQRDLPRLKHDVKEGKLQLRWEAPGGRPFPMPVEVKIGDSVRRVEMPLGYADIPLNPGQVPVVDPANRILKAESGISQK